MGTVGLIGGATASIIATSETETKEESEEEEKGKNSKQKPNQVSQKPKLVNTKQDLATVLPSNQRNLGIIITNGLNKPTIDMIKNKLPANIQNEVNITINSKKIKLQLQQKQLQQNTKIMQLQFNSKLINLLK